MGVIVLEGMLPKKVTARGIWLGYAIGGVSIRGVGVLESPALKCL